MRRPDYVLQNFDSEQRRRICCTLRFITHYYGAHLMFYSCYNEQLVKIGRSLFSHLAFGTSASKGRVDDHNRPIYLLCGMDTFEDHEITEKITDEQQLFFEPMIDNFVAQREKDLEVYIKQKKDRQAAEARAAKKITGS
ncbi:hypothetical protein COOONC_00981 [Cooperia oncophora]